MALRCVAGKYNWQAFFGNDRAYADDADGVVVTKASCVAFMRHYCGAAMQRRSLMMGAPADGIDNQTLASFLIVRPPIAFVGWGWESVRLDRENSLSLSLSLSL